MNILQKYKSDIFFILTVTIVLLLISRFFPAANPASPEAGYKYIQAESIYLSGWKNIGIPYYAEDIDPQNKYLKSDQIIESGSGLRIIYNPFFAGIASVFFVIFGEHTLYLLPIVFFIISIVIVMKTLIMILKDKMLSYLLVSCYIISSPIIFNSYIFEGFTLIVLMVSLSLYCLVIYFRRYKENEYILGAYMIPAFILLVRPEALVYIISFHLASILIFYLFDRKNLLKYVLTGLVSSICLLLFVNKSLYGTFLSPEYVPYIRSGLTDYGHNYVYLVLVCVISIAGFIVIFLNAKDTDERKSLEMFLPVVFLGFFSLLIWKAVILRLFAIFPICLLLFFRFNTKYDRNDDESLLQQLFFTIFIIYVLISSMISIFYIEMTSDIVIVPVIMLALSLKYRDIVSSGYTVRYIAVILLLLSVSSNIFFSGIPIARLKKTTYNMETFINNHTGSQDVVVFTDDNIAGLMGSLYNKKRFNIVRSFNGSRNLIDLLKKTGIRRVHIFSADNALVDDLSRYYKYDPLIKIRKKIKYGGFTLMTMNTG